MLLGQTLLTLLLAGKFLAAAKFIGVRIATWMGTGFFWKKGKDSGKKRFYWFACLVWLVSWGLVIYFSPKILKHIVESIRTSYNFFTHP